MGIEQKSSLISLVRQAVGDERNVHLRFKNGGQLIILGKDGLYGQSGCNLNDLLAATPANTSVKNLPATGPVVFSVREKGRELGELQWMLAHQICAGGGQGNTSDTDIFKLNRWPNFTRLPHSDNSLKMTALLTKRATSVALVSKILGIPIEQVRQFYAAAKEAGYTHSRTKADVVEWQSARRSDRSFISALLMKLKRM